MEEGGIMANSGMAKPQSLIEVPCKSCINYAMCLGKHEISCSILKDFYLDVEPNAGHIKYKSLFKERLNAISIALDKIIIDHGFDNGRLWLDLVPKNSVGY